MRAIDIIRVRSVINESWVQNASDKAETLHKIHDQLAAQHAGDQVAWRKSMSAAVNDMSDVWQDKELKQVLMEASFGKCWYCEARVAQRADNAIDHFRPKNRVAEDKSHPGYWWLACDWRNYRFACTFCNSARTTKDSTGGKQDHFPLWDESKRVRAPKEPLIGEQPKLLDPMSPGDVHNLVFDRSGKPAARYSKEQNSYQYERATESIRRYHLDRPELNKCRRDLMSSIDENLRIAEELAQDLGGQNAKAEAAYNKAVADIVECIRPDAEFSLAARVFIGTKRGNSGVARQVLEIAV